MTARYGPHAGAGEIDERTGTYRLDLWCHPCETSGAYGDDARGDAWSARYIANDGQAIEVAVFPVVYEDGSYGVDEQTVIYASVDAEDPTDIDYDYASALAFETLADAQAEADRLGQTDYSFAIQGKGTRTREEPTDMELAEFALMQGATREYIADADTDRLIADYRDDFMAGAA